MKKCANEKCQKANEFKVKKVSRIVRNVFSTFMFKNDQSEDGEPISYEAKSKKVVTNFKDNYVYNCINEKCEGKFNK